MTDERKRKRAPIELIIGLTMIPVIGMVAYLGYCNSKPQLSVDEMSDRLVEESTHDKARTRNIVKLLAGKAFLRWQFDNPRKDCPADISDLTSKINSDRIDTVDAWGTAYKIICGVAAPASSGGLVVISAGPDAQFDTHDDIASWGR